MTTQVTGGQIDNTDNAVETLYNYIIAEQYSYTGTTTYADNYINAANSIGMGLAFSGENNPKTDAAFMMANKEAVEVTPDVNNTETNPCVAEVEVERALSKITFRTANKNIYPVELSTGTVPAETGRGAYDPAGGTTYQAATFNKATLNHDNATEVYALYDASNEFVGVYQKSTTETTTVGEESNLPIFTRLTPHTAEAYEDLEDKSNAYIASGATDDTDITLAEEAASFTLVINEDAVTENTTWYVRLEGYALVNLAKEVNYVRHTVSANGGLETPFGTLNGTKCEISDVEYADSIYTCKYGTLSGNKCIITKTDSINPIYYCTGGYTLVGNKCYITESSSDIKDATPIYKTKTEKVYKWSTSTKLEGWIYTGEKRETNVAITSKR